MKIHTIFVEPANYTQDLIVHVYQPQTIGYSFLHSNSSATNDIAILKSASNIFDQNGLFKNLSFLWKCSKENDLMIINGYNHLAFIILWFFSKINGCFVGIESDTPYAPKSGLKSILKTIYLKLIFSNDKILGLPGGNFLHRELFLNYGMPKERVFFLPMVVNNSKFFHEIHDDVVNHLPIRFLFVGRFIWEKNLQFLIRAFKQLLSECKKAQLTMVGDGVFNEELRMLSKDITEIKFVGKKFGADLLREYSVADVLILPSCSETWGLVMNEALSAGLPVLCSSAVGAATDLILKPDTGWVFKTDDKTDLIAKLYDIIDNPIIIREKAKRGQDFMLNYWNYGLYSKCLNQILAYAKKD